MASSRAAWRSPSLGEGRELRLPQGTIRYHEAGSGPALVFVHGALVNANLWRKVVAELSADFRCVALDLPLGAHALPMPENAEVTPGAVAHLIADAIEALELEDVTLVGNDTGGALCQLVATRRPERIGRLVLTSCDAFEVFPPRVVKPMLALAKVPGALGALYAPLRIAPLRQRFLPLITATKRPVDPKAVDSFVFPVIESGGVRRDAQKLMGSIDSRDTLEAAERLRSFDRPALLAWSREDKFFPAELGERLAGTIRGSRLEWIDDAYTFSPEDEPGRVAELIAGFVREPAGAAA